MATYCDTCGGVPEFHTGDQCWCEDYCKCKVYVEGGTTIPHDANTNFGKGKCRHCEAPLEGNWWDEQYCLTCQWYSGDVSVMQPGDTFTVNYQTGAPFGGFCTGKQCAICEPYYVQPEIYHVCYVDGGCHDCGRGIPRRLPMPDHMKSWKCGTCNHGKAHHPQGEQCMECKRLHRRRCYSWIMRQPAETRMSDELITQIAKRFRGTLTVIRPIPTKTGEATWIQ